MTDQVAAALVQALGGRVPDGTDRPGGGHYIATVEVKGPPSVQLVDARPSDPLNLAALVQAPIFAAPRCCTRRRPDAQVTPQAARLRRVQAAPPMTVGTGRPRGCRQRR